MRTPLILLAGLAIACHRDKVDAPHGPTVDAELVRTLAVLATGHAPARAEVDATLGNITSGRLALDAYITQLLATKAFSTQIAPLVIMRQTLSVDPVAAPEPYILKHTETTPPLYFLWKPCAPADATQVAPWWDLDHPVAVCPDSYQPDHWISTRLPGETIDVSCASYMNLFRPDGGCGCGPNLFRCFRAPEERIALAEGMRDELRRTVAWTVEHDLPIEQLFLSNETYRGRDAERVRRAGDIELRRDEHPEATLRELDAWPVDGRWAPRADRAKGENAGILTSSLLMQVFADRRQRMTVIDNVLWCDEVASIGATPELVASLVGGNDLQLKSDGWKALAARTLCTNCHARLDYGFQFWMGFPNSNQRPFFDPSEQLHGRGPMYGQDIDDRRGEADLDPHSFAVLAIAQPEFRNCMVRDVANYVLGARATADAVAVVEAAYRPGATTVRALMRSAMLQLAEHWAQRNHEPAAQPQPRTGPAQTTIALTGELKRRVADQCGDCHDGKPDRPDFGKPSVDRRTAVAMVDAIGFARMPKDKPLVGEPRKALLELLIAQLWSGADADTARAWFDGAARALPAYRPEVIFELVHHTHPTEWKLTESGVRPNQLQVTPGLAVVGAAAAIEACHDAGSADARAACIHDALAIDNLVLGR